ncbi:MAG: hypothetical protein HY690_15750, partial [Chloroflexi bacterium]|nr:hypothetical protein [Chloroflexota bacterium]
PSPLYRTVQSYDHRGNLTRVVRASGDGTYERAVDYLYDGLNRLRREVQYPSWPTTSPTLVTEWSYDGNGNRLTLLDPLGQTTSSGYDALNRLTSLSYSDGLTPSVSFGYGAHGLPSAGRHAWMITGMLAAIRPRAGRERSAHDGS